MLLSVLFHNVEHSCLGCRMVNFIVMSSCVCVHQVPNALLIKFGFTQ
jgi:hypothetical protein